MIYYYYVKKLINNKRVIDVRQFALNYNMMRMLSGLSYLELFQN